MQRLQHTTHAQPTRRDWRARVSGWGASMASADGGVDGAVVMLGALVTTKINPRRVPGGLPREGGR